MVRVTLALDRVRTLSHKHARSCTAYVCLSSLAQLLANEHMKIALRYTILEWISAFFCPRALIGFLVFLCICVHIMYYNS